MLKLRVTPYTGLRACQSNQVIKTVNKVIVLSLMNSTTYLKDFTLARARKDATVRYNRES